MIINIIACDNDTKTEWVVKDFDKEKIQAMAEHGIVFYAENLDGTRQEISWSDVSEPVMTKTSEVIPVITTVLFAKVMEPLLDSIKALESRQAVAPIATISAQSSSSTNTPLYDATKNAYEEVMALFDGTEVS